MRHKKVKKREVIGDDMYNSPVVTKFINRLMKHGKKTAAERAFYGAFAILEEKKENPMEIFEKAILNVSPKQEVKARRVGGANYQVPIEVRGERKMSLAIRWLAEAANARSNKEFHTFSEKLAIELLEASKNEGTAIKKKDSMQRMADANRAFSHFRF